MTPANYDLDMVQKLAKDSKESELNTVEVASHNISEYHASKQKRS